MTRQGMTRQELIEHVKAIGRRIIGDAENVVPDPKFTAAITITAEITPEKISTVTYNIMRYADRRIEQDT